MEIGFSVAGQTQTVEAVGKPSKSSGKTNFNATGKVTVDGKRYQVGLNVTEIAG